MPANPSPAPEVLARLVELEGDYALNTHLSGKDVRWLCRELRDALTALTAAQDEQEATIAVWEEAKRELAAATREAETLREALLEAFDIIHTFHGEAGWGIYFQQSPEMKRLRAALAPRSPDKEGT